MRAVGWAASRRGAIAAGVLALVMGAGNARATVIDATFDSSILSSPNAAAIEGAINTAIGVIDGLYTNATVIPVKFTYDPASAGNLLSTTQAFYTLSYSNYVGLLQADSAANPQNTVLTTALAHLSSGNGAGGGATMLINGNQYNMLTGTTAHPASSVININSLQAFAFSRPVSSSSYDLIGGLEHELDEVLGGGGAGSSLNACQSNAAFCSMLGGLDLYRYAAPHVASHTTSSGATAYLSVDGGVTNIVGFNQRSGGDFADFGPPCGTNPSGGQLIQNAFNCKGQDEAYTPFTTEFIAMETLGWNGTSSGGTPIPEPGSLALLGSGLVGLITLRRRRTAVAA
jgi:hypothetical protein